VLAQSTRFCVRDGTERGGMADQADFVVRAYPSATMDPRRPWAEAFAVRDGVVLRGGGRLRGRPGVRAATRMLDSGAVMVMPGLVDVHSHIGFGGRQVAWELSLNPSLTLAEVLAAVRERAECSGQTSGWLAASCPARC